MTQKTNKIIVLLSLLLSVVVLIIGVKIYYEKDKKDEYFYNEAIPTEAIKKCEYFLSVEQEFRNEKFIPDWVMCKVENRQVTLINYEDLFKGTESIEPKSNSKIIVSFNLPEMFKRGLVTVEDTHGNIEANERILIPNNFNLCFIIGPRVQSKEWSFWPKEIISSTSYDYPCKNYSKAPYDLFVCTKAMTKENAPIISIGMRIPNEGRLKKETTERDRWDRVYFGIKMFITKNEVIVGGEKNVSDLIEHTNEEFIPFYRFRIPIIF